MNFVPQSLNCPLPITIWPFGCHLMGSIQAHLILHLFWCCKLCNPIQLNLHCSTDIMNLFFSNWYDSLANTSSTLAFADFNIFWTGKAPFLFENRFSASFSAVRHRSEWFCWLTSRESSYNAQAASITMLSDAVSTAVFPPSWEQSGTWKQFTASVLMVPQILFPCQEPYFDESNGLEKCWRPWCHGTDVNRLTHWSLTFLAFRYLSSQCNKYLTKPRSSWCNSAGYERR